MKLLDIIKEMALSKGQWQPIPSSELKDFEEDIFNLISTAYAPIGGHPNYKSPADVTGAQGEAEYEVIDLDDDPDIDAVSVSKQKPAGKKFAATGHDNSSKAKSKVVNHKADLLKKSGHFIEVSGRIFDILKAKGVGIVDDEEAVRKALQGKDIEWHGDGSYDRVIGGQKHRKVMMGKPK